MPIGPSHSGRSRSSSRSSSSSSSRSSSSYRSRSRNVRPHHNPSGSSLGAFFLGSLIGSLSNHDSENSRSNENYQNTSQTPPIPKTQRSAIFIVLLFFISLFLIFFLIANNRTKSELEDDVSYYSSQVLVMESDAEFYEDLITKANANQEGYYKTTAEFGTKIAGEYKVTTYDFYPPNPTSIGAYYSHTNNITAWYFIVYKYNTGSQTVTSSTYTQYSSSQYLGMNGQVEIAYTKVNNVLHSINTDYTLDINQDYILAKSRLEDKQESLKSANTTITIESIILAITIVGLIASIVISIKKTKEEKVKFEKEQKLAKEAAEKQKRIEEYGHTCKYCGSPIPKGENECENCGSNIFDE